MKQITQQSPQSGTADNPGSEPVFFFDGDFRTWGQVERRAQLNKAIAAQLSQQR